MTAGATFFMPRPESPISQPGGRIYNDWYLFQAQLYMAATDGRPQPESAITVTASPFTYAATVKGQVNISGGAGLTIEFTRNGTTFYAAGAAPCMIAMCRGDRVRVTYAGAPTMVFFPM